VTNYTFYIPPPCNEAVEILYADEDLLVVSKPAGLLSAPGRIVKDSVLLRMRAEYPDVAIVHRLDLDTSGLLVLSLSQRASSDLNRQFRERVIDKEYVALVDGLVAEDTGEVELPIASDPDNRPRQVIDEENGRSALTRFQVLTREDNCTRLQLVPVTGRSHQLRIHMAAVGHPILGCDLYATENAFQRADRLLLHAVRLGFCHPGSGERLEFESNSPF